MNHYLECPVCKNPINNGDRVHINVFKHEHWGCVSEHFGADSIFNERDYFSDLESKLFVARELVQNVREIAV